MTIVEFVAALNEKFNGFPNVSIDKPESKYVRIVTNFRIGTDSWEVYCFIDHEGNIYKAASWTTPAKGVRSTLATVDIGKVDSYGSWLYR